jgi:DNA polymerase III subunit gamma/tau
VLDDMLSLLHLAALCQFHQSAAAFSEQQDYVQQLAATLPAAQIQLYYQLLISGKKELPYAPDPLTGLEMALLRAMAFVPETLSNTGSPVKHPVTAASQKSVQPVVTEEAVVSPAGTIEPETAQAIADPVLQNNTPEPVHTAQADGGANIDPVTARIMARRGVQITAAPVKKFERQQAPTSAADITDTSQRPIQVHPTAADTVMPATEKSPVQQPNSTIDELGSRADDDVDLTDDADMPQYDAMAADALWQQYEQDLQHNDSVPDTAATTLDSFDGSINEQNFSVRFAAQVDAWAARVETLDTGGLSRLFLLNSAMQLTGNQLRLTVAQSQQHLDSADFRHKLQHILSVSFNQPLTIEIAYQTEVLNSPLAIQQKIVQERLVYVSRLLQTDNNVLQLQHLFDATLLPDTIVVN